MRKLEVNWRPGTTSVFESIWNLRRKFSFLNRLDVALTNDAIRADNCGVDGDLDLGNSMLEFLGEPFQIFCDCSLGRFLLPAEITGGDRRFKVVNLRFCEACIVRGYHSPIHQLPWVACCPIHGIPLRERCPECGNIIPVRIWANGNLGHQRTKSKINTDFCHCNLWPGMADSQWPSGLKRSDVRPIGAYLRWLDTLLVMPDVLTATAARQKLNVTARGNSFNEDLFYIWRQILPPPARVEAFLAKHHISSVRTDIVFPTGTDAQNVVDSVNTCGYVTFEEGLLNQLTTRLGERTPWDYQKKRLSGRLALIMQLQCQQVLLKKVGREFWSLSSVDMAKIPKSMRPNSGLISLIKLRDSSLKWTTRILTSRAMASESAATTWLDNYLIDKGLARPATLRELLGFRQRFEQQYCKQLPSKVIWGDALFRFASLVVSAGHIAAVSCLIRAYNDFRTSRENRDGAWDKLIASGDVRWPYIILTTESANVLSVTVWFRHKPIEPMSFDGL